MEKIYILTPNSGELEDIRIIINEEEAIKLSKQYPSCTVEIFEKDDKLFGYIMSYKYFQNGILYNY
jgi:hypothetical protein